MHRSRLPAGCTVLAHADRRSGMASALELWGGIECTVNRVGDSYRDQVVLSGHDRREDDLALFAGLGLRAMRYPVLWERVAPDPARPPDWTWSDRRLSRLRELGIRPIVGLVHHGSGPRHTDLLNPNFASELGRYAGLVAARYPWIEDWTPINEPLTTARFSALYGHWYPHRRDQGSFWLALLNQVDATRAAMRAIRGVNPGARLIQTDDLGRTYATAPVGQQAAHDNERRWAGWDLLFGRVDGEHPLFTLLVSLGFADRLKRIADDPCVPDVIGVNHYLTSDRFLDHRIERYPLHLRGGNGEMKYADTEAVRVLDPPIEGLAVALHDAWERYNTPVALTEVHNGSTREEQMRWVTEAWDAAVAARTAGVDVRAVTAWSLLGSYGWNTLLTEDGAYEPGVFDLSSGTPRPTALATLWSGLPDGRDRHPVAMEPGWWRRPDRLIYPPHPSGAAVVGQVNAIDRAVLIRDPNGLASRTLVEVCRARGIHHVVDGASDDMSATGMVDEGTGPPVWLVIDVRTPVEQGLPIGRRHTLSIEGTGMDAADGTLRHLPITMSLSCRELHGPAEGVLGEALQHAIDGLTGRWCLHDDGDRWAEMGAA